MMGALNGSMLMGHGTSRPGSRSGIRGLGHRFADPELLERALTHRSCGNGNYERLEFLGDAVLNCVVAELLYLRHPDLDEGDLSRLRALLVRERSLAEIARQLQLGDQLRLGPGELKSGGYLRASILADAVEALIGAVFLDAGYASARAQIVDWIGERIESPPPLDSLKDSKTRLQELLQGRGLALPVYELVEAQGAEHARSFRVRCTVEALAEPLEARGGSRRKAEQAAAAAVLQAISESSET